MKTQAQYNEEILPCIPELSRTALRLTRGNALADDLVQETLARAWQARASFSPGTNARAWTRRILFNTYINHYRKKKREREALEELRRLASVRVRSSHDGFSDEVLAALRSLKPGVPRGRGARRPRRALVSGRRRALGLPRGHRDVPSPPGPEAPQEYAGQLRARPRHRPIRRLVPHSRKQYPTKPM